MMRGGLFLDLDGTLADSLGAMRLAYDRFLAGFGRRGGDAEFAALNGPPLPEVVARLAAAHGLEGPPEGLLARYQGLVDAVYDDAGPMPGAAALIAAARGAGRAVAVVTSNSRARAARWLARRGIDHDLVVAGGEAARGKPAPDPYLAALAATGCAAAASIAVEDAPQGAAAALAAGLETWVLQPGGGPWDGPAVAGRVARLDMLCAVAGRPPGGTP
ncbi:MAG TPA: HAD-IA family hydrolase [Alphaproteobacteria bacterium]|nr:HAD-IA family hydrolase [Alphaproteobacteria bacterium]